MQMSKGCMRNTTYVTKLLTLIMSNDSYDVNIHLFVQNLMRYILDEKGLTNKEW